MIADAEAAIAELEAVAAEMGSPLGRHQLSVQVGALLGRLAALQAELTGLHPLAAVRAQRGWSYGALARLVARSAAEHLGIRNMAAGRQKVWRWEHWSVTPDTESQLALAIVLGVPQATVIAEPWPAWLRHAVGAEVEDVAS